MDTAYLLDASALLALLRDEPGADQVMEIIDRASVHAVQLAEVVKKLADVGVHPDDCKERIDRLALPIIEEFSAGLAYNTHVYCVKGISLADRICLSVANGLGMTAVTGDRRWLELAGERPDWNVKVALIRNPKQ